MRWTIEVAIDLRSMMKPRPMVPVKSVPRWRPPDQDSVKINVDAAFYRDAAVGAAGAIIRDHLGAMIRSQALWYEHAMDPLVLEAKALRDGVQLACNLGLQKVQLETDSLGLVNLWNGTGQNRSIISAICQEVKELIRSFTSFSLSYVSKLANQAAHVCAKQASESRRRYLWVNYNPLFLARILSKDCNLIV